MELRPTTLHLCVEVVIFLTECSLTRGRAYWDLGSACDKCLALKSLNQTAKFCHSLSFLLIGMVPSKSVFEISLKIKGRGQT